MLALGTLRSLWNSYARSRLARLALGSLRSLCDDFFKINSQIKRLLLLFVVVFCRLFLAHNIYIYFVFFATLPLGIRVSAPKSMTFLFGGTISGKDSPAAVFAAAAAAGFFFFFSRRH